MDYVSYHGGYGRMTVIHRDFSKATESVVFGKSQWMTVILTYLP
jgi:hypothetical protein